MRGGACARGRPLEWKAFDAQAETVDLSGLTGRYQPDEDGDWPDGYWADLQQAVDRLLQKAIELNQPVLMGGQKK